MWRTIVGLILGLALISAPALASDEKLGKAKRVYKQFCAHCHGLNMVNPGTSSYDLRKFPTDQKERFYKSVIKGSRNMPAWGDVITPAEMELLWFYVATRAGKQPFPETSSAEPEQEEKLKTLQPGKLTACLAKNGGVMSSWRHGGGTGLDYFLAEAIAERSGLELEVTWFESEQEEESNPVKEIYGMLSYDLCDIAPGVALYDTARAPYAGQRAALPRWRDRPDHLGQEFQVDLKPVQLSTPYARVEFAIVVREGVPDRFSSLKDLEGLTVGIEQGTLPGVLVLRQGNEAIRASAKTFNPGPGFLWKMETGAFDAALVPVAAYDFHKRQNRITKLKLTSYRHPLGFNLGVATRADNRALGNAANKIIPVLLTDGTLVQAAKKSKLHFSPPQKPDFQPRLTMRDILSGG
ncbi:MAG: c-type cytochrome [Pseudomonadota bacterium]